MPFDMVHKLSDEEVAFLKRLGFEPDDVFDARGMSPSIWQPRAKAAGKQIVLGTPCRAKKHRLRARSNKHCIQCDTSQLAYQERDGSSGYVYIAGSSTGRVIKIGSAEYVFERERRLRSTSYGGFSDWEVVFFVHVNERGRIERSARAKLSMHKVPVLYEKDGFTQKADEILRCSFGPAHQAVIEVTAGTPISREWKSPYYFKYEFDWFDDPS